MASVTLKDGSEMPLAIVKTTHMSLKFLVEAKKFSALNELIQICKDPKYKLSPENSLILKKWVLIDENDAVHGSVKAVVLNSIQIDGNDMNVISPLKFH